jgi:hypothetical protein
MNKPSERFLLIYSAVLSTTFAAVVLLGAKSHRNESFDEIQVHRINVVEPDGTLRMVISDHDKLPGVIVKGKEQPPNPSDPRPQAGMLFYNDEGSENGGLIFGGHLNGKGEVVDGGVSLSFDRYADGQILQLAGVDDATDHFAGLSVGDKSQRVWVGRTDDGNATVSLMDTKGHERIVMQVDKDGTPSLRFLDEKGKTLQQLAPSAQP